MRKVVCVFSGANYDETTAAIVERAPKMGADEVIVYDDKYLETTEFRKLNSWLWDHHKKRGYGWYAWKSYIIYDAIQRLSRGDVCMYIDADTVPIANFGTLFDLCAKEGGITLFEASAWPSQSQWCKTDCYYTMGMPDNRYKSQRAGCARFSLFQAGNWRATQFLMEWLTYSVNKLSTTFDPSIIADEPDDFTEHRTEQAIMTNLAHKYSVPLHREADQHGIGRDLDWNLYPQLFVQCPTTSHLNTTAPVLGSKYFNATVRSSDR